MHSLSSANKYCINSYEQQKRLDERLDSLSKCLSVADKLRQQTDASRRQIKENTFESYQQLRHDLNRLENNAYLTIEHNLVQKHVEKPLRQVETQIHQLVGNLRSLSMLNDAEKLLVLKSIDASIRQIETKLKEIDDIKKNHIDKLSSKTHLNRLLGNQFDRVEKMLIDENMNLNTLVMYKSENNEPEYKKWLLNETKKEETVEKAQQRRDSFDFDDMSDELESIGVCTSDLEDVELNNWIVTNPKSAESKQNSIDAITGYFREAYAKPLDFWLLKSN